MRLGLGLGIVKSAASIYKGILDKFPNAVAAYSTRKLKTSAYPTTLPADYGGGAAAAYSLRKVKSDYEGSAVRVRKAVSSVSEETDIGFDANGNLDTATLLSFASDADNGDVFVSIWYDQSGNDNRATNSTASEQPLVVSGGTLVTENGKAAIDFSAVNGLRSSVNFGTNTSIFSVFKNADTQGVIYSGTSIGSDFIYAFRTNTGGIASGVTVDATYKDASLQSLTNQTSVLNAINTGSQLLWSSFLSSVDTARYSDLSIGAGVLGDTDIIWSEIIIFDSDQSANRKDIEWNINNHYSIYEQWDRKSCMNVRRSSDNATQDIGFSGKNINQTQLESFVNDASPVLDDYTGAAAAYSLRKVRSAYTGSAIRVRRSSDDTEQDIGFDSNGDLDTTALTTFVNAEHTFVDEDFSSSTGWILGTGTSITDGVLRANTTSFVLSYKPYVDTGAQQVRVTFTISNYGGGTVTYRNFGGGATGTARSANGTYTETLTLNAGGNANHGFQFDSNFVGDIDNFEIVQLTADGAVTTFYDQSGNGNNASNSTDSEQPLIVEAGDVVLENNKPAIKFDGVNDDLTFSSEILTDTHYMSMVAANTTKGRILGDDAAYGHFLESGATNNRYRINFNLYNLGTRIFQTQELVTWSRVTTSSEFFQDGTSINSATVVADDYKFKVIGSNNNDVFSDGIIQELIIFNSDQSSNRLSIEGNIGRYYNITGYRDGFVTKWYDQSGEYNHAENSTSDEQPQIVSNGSMLKENGKAAIQFDGVDDTFNSGSFLNALDDASIINVSTPTATNAFSSIYSGFDSFISFNILFRYNDDSKLIVSLSGLSANGSYSTSTSYAAQQNLIFMNFDNSLSSGNQVDIHLNGSDANASGSNDVGTLKSPTNGYIGSRDGVNNFNGNMQELIIFDSDQSTNREDIEKNINTHFKIYS